MAPRRPDSSFRSPGHVLARLPTLRTRPPDPDQDIQLRLQTLPPPNRAPSWPLKLARPPDADAAADAPALPLPQLSTVRNRINQSLDVVDVSTWSGDAQDANFIVGQLRLLHDLLHEARGLLKGGDEVTGRWWEESLDEQVGGRRRRGGTGTQADRCAGL